MLIKLLVALAQGGETLDAGNIIYVENTRAEELIAEGYAEDVESEVAPSIIDDENDEVPPADPDPEGKGDEVPPVDGDPEQPPEGEPQNIPLGRSGKKNGGK